MHKINKKYLKRCMQTNCFKIAKFSSKKLMTFKYEEPLDYFNHFWKEYEKFKLKYFKQNKENINNTYNGTAFETIMAFLMEREKVKILKMDETIKDVKFVKPDFLVDNESGNKIFISLKVSGRERWKQAELESLWFKKKYPNSITILLMNHARETTAAKEKIPYLDLDYAFFAGSNDLNQLFKIIKE